MLGVSAPTARKIAQTDPDFPPVIVMGPRTHLVPEADLLRFIEGKKVAGQRLANGGVKA